MVLQLPHALLLLVGTAVGSPLLSTPKGPACQEFKIPVEVSSDNLKLPSNVLPTDPLAGINEAVHDAVHVTVSGRYNIAVRYCEPEVNVASRRNTLQILGHGNTYDKNYWSGLGFPGYQGDKYSWISYASKQGYPTLSIDRLGNGDSSHPDPIAEVQLPMQIEILHKFVVAARAGTLSSKIPRPFDKIIYAGHSYGSFLGNGLSDKYPSDIDSYVLTGFTNHPFQLAAPAEVAHSLFLPAALVNPTRFGGLPLGYLAGASKSGRELEFYSRPGVDFDPAIFELDWATAGTATVGEAATGTFATAAEYTGSVFVLTGRNDTVLCGYGTGEGDCGQGETSIPAQTRALYPKVSQYGYWIPEDTGHDWNLHFAAPEGFKKVHDWLRDVGF